jgi:hypothetical protein
MRWLFLKIIGVYLFIIYYLYHRHHRCHHPPSAIVCHPTRLFKSVGFILFYFIFFVSNRQPITYLIGDRGLHVPLGVLKKDSFYCHDAFWWFGGFHSPLISKSIIFLAHVEKFFLTDLSYFFWRNRKC